MLQTIEPIKERETRFKIFLNIKNSIQISCYLIEVETEKNNNETLSVV